MRLLRIIWVFVAIATAFVIGESYISRLPDHRGFFLVPVTDQITVAPAETPRRTLVIVVDGLREDFARKMPAIAQLKKFGQCRSTDVGPISVSRPVYAVISTGLEQDRTGARNNDETSPLAAESIWDVAREAKKSVQGASALPWWQQLFPNGFSAYGEIMQPIESYDLTLWHPLYVDSAGHDAGARSPGYRAAADRVNEELAQVFARVDFAQDLVVVTADHGHSELGGHGGTDPEIRKVLTCFAGHGVRIMESDQPITTRMIAPALAVLLGLRFPKHMRAGEDELDTIFELADPAAFSPEYLADRKSAIEKYRAANHTALEGWLGEAGTWSELYARERSKQILRAVFVAALVLGGLIASFRRRKLERSNILFMIGWTAAIAALTVVLHIYVRGSFDWTAINIREDYLRAATLICFGPAVLGLAAHYAIHRDMRRLADDQLTLMSLLVALAVAVPVAVGWQLGFPLPSPVWLLYPFFGSIALATHAIIALVIVLGGLIVVAVRSRRAR